jgi:hypothetical protein
MWGLSPNTGARVEIDPGGVLRVYQPVDGCLDRNIGNLYARVTMSILRVGPGGPGSPPPGTQYVLRGVKEVDADARVKTCGIITNFLQGLATATIGQGGSSPCKDVIAKIVFQVSPSEWFYATALDTDGDAGGVDVFYIAGRSSFAEGWRGSRTLVPPC